MTGPECRAALYLRLSREDGEHENGSESIRNQRELLQRYAQDHGFTVCGEYADDGWSGTRFDRPDFQRMLRDIEAGSINAVLTKDLSRLGRDYILTGHYLERYFPEHGVRYVAVNDGIDTGDLHAANDMTPFKAVINDLYARDISKKVRSALETKRACGKFIGARAPYGYQKDPADKNHLIPDCEKADAVKRIFRMFLGGETLSGVARRMDTCGIAPPGKDRGATRWNNAMVRRILMNPVYTGDLTQGKTRKLSYKLNKRTAVPQSAWAVVLNAHEALITREEYEAAQALLQKKARGRNPLKPCKHPLSGLVFCGVCGLPMTLLRQGAREYFVCSGWKRGGGSSCTVSHCIRADAVLGAVLGELHRHASQLTAQQLVALVPERKPGQTQRATQKLEEEESALISLYRDKARGIVPEAEYLRLAALLRRERQERKIHLELAQCEEQGREERLLTLAQQLLQMEQPDAGMLAVLVERVTVNEGKKLVFRFAFCAPRGLHSG